MINKEFFQALEDFAKEKIISKEVLVDALESGIAAAYKKEYGESKPIAVRFNEEKTGCQRLRAQDRRRRGRRPRRADLSRRSARDQTLLQGGRRRRRGHHSQGLFPHRGADREAGHHAETQRRQEGIRPQRDDGASGRDPERLRAPQGRSHSLCRDKRLADGGRHGRRATRSPPRPTTSATSSRCTSRRSARAGTARR